FTRCAPDMRDIPSTPAPVGRAKRDDRSGLVIGIVEDLDLQQIAWPVQPADRVEHAFRDIALVVDRNLDANQLLSTGVDQATWRRSQLDRAPREVQEVRAETAQRDAGDD